MFCMQGTPWRRCICRSLGSGFASSLAPPCSCLPCSATQSGRSGASFTWQQRKGVFFHVFHVWFFTFFTLAKRSKRFLNVAPSSDEATSICQGRLGTNKHKMKTCEKTKQNKTLLRFVRSCDVKTLQCVNAGGWTTTTAGARTVAQSTSGSPSLARWSGAPWYSRYTR